MNYWLIFMSLYLCNNFQFIDNVLNPISLQFGKGIEVKLNSSSGVIFLAGVQIIFSIAERKTIIS